MTPEEAIRVLATMLTKDPQFDPDLRRKAVRLGIEALKRLQDLRSRGHPGAFALLPGETEE